MTKRKDTAHQRLVASAKRALAAKHAVSPVPAFNAKAARLGAAGKRLRRAEAAPPAEQLAKGHFVEVDVNEHSMGYDEDGTPFVSKVRIGRAYQRQPRFETIVGLSITQVMALRRYRRAFDASELSPVKSGLDIGAGGGGGGPEAALSRIEAIAFADVALQRIEAAVPSQHLPILRAVALHDADFKAFAMARYGGASSHRRNQVRDAFLRAATALATGIAPAPQQGAPVPIAIVPVELPPVDPSFVDERGFMRPMAEIADILRGGGGDVDDKAA